ncbi:MAG: HAMP domain-containing histidine kinase [Candidatus Obscuribacterales bacterium]|nr:HAMP domain-containing histidine kinase [Candidatus Obscuribacterales bacterium]
MSRKKVNSKSLSLQQKLRLLVALPLLFLFVFVISLTALLIVAQTDVERVERAKETQLAGNDIVQGMYKMVSMAYLYSQKGDATVLSEYLSSKKSVKPQLKRLRAVCATNVSAKQSAERVSVLLNRLVDTLDELTDASKSGFVGYATALSSSVITCRLIMQECAKIAEVQRQIHPQPTTNTDWQRIIFIVLAVGLLSCVVVSVGALRFVHLDILQRLSLIMRNTESLGRREPLTESVGGSDEIADLDQFIYSTDDSLRQLERTRQEFVSMLTHDMRVPLTQIQFSVGLLAEGAYEDNPAKRQDMLVTLVPEIGRLNRMIDDLLTANKLDAEPLKLNLETLSARELLNQVCEAMQIEASSRERSVKVTADDSKVLADQFQLSRVLTNLCANALRYTPANSVVELRCRAEDEHVVLEVIDEGPGVPDELAPHLFERYRQGSEEQDRSGFGLGLYIAKSIVEAHDGEIGFQNRLDRGCVFFVTLKAHS